MLSPIKGAKKEKVNLEREKTKAGRENMDRPWRWAQRCPWPPMCGNEATLPVAPIAPNLSVITGTGSSNHFSQTNCFSNETIVHQLILGLYWVIWTIHHIRNFCILSLPGMIKLFHTTSNFVMWYKIYCHVEQFCSTQTMLATNMMYDLDELRPQSNILALQKSTDCFSLNYLQ